MLAGIDAMTLNRDERARIRNKEIGVIFQAFNLISDMSVAENVELPLTYRDDLSRTERKALVNTALEKVDMLHRANHYPSQLSGGQQQRVAVARAISGNPSIILADEPTGNLDSKTTVEIMQLFDELHGEGQTLIVVTHEDEIAQHCRRVVEMKDGRVFGICFCDDAVFARRLHPCVVGERPGHVLIDAAEDDVLQVGKFVAHRFDDTTVDRRGRHEGLRLPE